MPANEPQPSDDASAEAAEIILRLLKLIDDGEIDAGSPKSKALQRRLEGAVAAWGVSPGLVSDRGVRSDERQSGRHPVVGSTSVNEEVVVPLAKSEAFEAALRAFESIGKVNSVQRDFARIQGKIRAGRWNSGGVPTLLIAVERSDDSHSLVKVSATGVSGVINMGSTQKCVMRYLDALAASCSL